MGPMCRAWLLALLAGLPRWAPAAPGGDEVLLSRIRQKMAETLTRMPDYTCVQTIERWREGDPCAECGSWERLRLEVAVIGGRERFAWPGASQFEDRDIEEIVPGGAIGTGDFSGFATAVFRSGAASFAGPKAEQMEGREVWRYDYRVPQERSGYTLRDGHTSQRVAYHGSFWVDRHTLELLRLDVEAEGLPAPPLEITAARTAIRYAKTPIGNSVFLLPLLSELSLSTPNRRSRNRTSFAQCRQYVGQSSLRFDEAAPAADSAQAAIRRLRLPEGLTLHLSLSESVDPARAAAGDALQANLARELRQQGRVLAPKGARVRGRLRGVRQHLRPRQVGVLVLEFNRLEAPGLEAEFNARLELLGGIIPGARRAGDVVVAASEQESAILFNGPLLRLPRGLPMQWRTLH